MINHNVSPQRATEAIGRWLSLSMVCVLLASLLPNSLALARTPSASPDPIVVHYEFSAPVVSEVGGYHAVRIEGLPNLNRPGLPCLPIKTAKLLVPFDQEVAQVRVIPGREVTFEGPYRVEPGQQPVPLSHVAPVSPTLPAPEVYGSAQPFPGELHSPAVIQHRKGYRLLVLTLYPVEYLPQPGTLSYYERLTVQVDLRPTSWEPDATRMLRRRPGQWNADRAEVRMLVDNPAATDAYPTAAQLARARQVEATTTLDPGTPCDYVIVTDEALMAAPGPYNFQALKADKAARGISTLITTTEWISTTYSGLRPDGGVDLQTKIRSFVADAYGTWGIEYVLLGGDGDDVGVGGDAIIPHRGFVVTSTDYSDYDIPTDMYYGCLDGTFDHNGNGFYGEPDDGPDGGEVDLFAEVYVGRAPVDSYEELSNFVRKTLVYQVDNDDYLRQVWMVGEKLADDPDPLTWGGDAKDDIIDGSDLAGYTTTVTATIGFTNSAHAAFFDVHTLYDRDRDPDRWTKAEITAVINSPSHIINHLGHTGPFSAMRLSIADVTGTLTNTHYFIGYSQGCYAGAFELTYSDTIVEYFISEEHGAVAFVANSRYGWFDFDPHLGASHYYDREFWEAVLGEDLPQIGRANQDSKEDTYGMLGAGGFTWVMRWCHYELNVFGDPALAVKTGIPNLSISKTAEPDPVPAGGVLTYTLTVSNAGSADATWVAVTDTIPVHTTFRSAEDGGTLVGDEVRWTGQTVNADESLVLRFSVTVTLPLTHGTMLTNSDYAVQCAEGVSATGSVVTTTVTNTPVLEIGKVGEPDPAPAGDVLTYTLTVSNTGSADATGVVVTDTIPTHTAFRSAEDGGTLVGDEVRWAGQTVNAGESLALRFSVTVTLPLTHGTMLANSDYAVQCAEGVSATGSVVTTTVTSAPVLEIGKVGEPDPVPAGGVLTYTLTVSNAGSANATGVVVTDTVPAHTTFRSAEDGGTLVGDEVRWTGQTVNAGDSLTLRFSVTVTNALPKDTTIVNGDYGVRCAEGVTKTGDPITTDLRWYEIYLPIVLRQ